MSKEMCTEKEDNDGDGDGDGQGMIKKNLQERRRRVRDNWD